MNAFFEQTRIFVVAGPGGVGKTTLSAALAATLAERYRTIVLTVDPSRRLRQLLGVGGDRNRIETVSLADGKSFRVSCLEVETYFDRVVDRFAPNPEHAAKIKANPLYRTMTASLGGTHEYAAIERLWELSREGEYEKIVIDTPPAQNAIDLILAPGRLVGLLEGPLIQWFARRVNGGGGGPLPWLQSGTKIALALLQKVFGGDFLDQLGRFFNDMESLRQGFLERHREIQRLLRDPSTGFLLVSRPTEGRFEECRAFFAVLAQQGIAPARIVLNRVEPPPPQGGAREGSDAARWLAFVRAEAAVQKAWIERFCASFATAVHQVPRQRTEPEDLAALTFLGRFLID